MYKLFYALKSASMGVRVILEEIGAPYELIQTSIDMDKPRPSEQLAINPNGWVPVLIWESCGTGNSWRKLLTRGFTSPMR